MRGPFMGEGGTVRDTGGLSRWRSRWYCGWRPGRCCARRLSRASPSHQRRRGGGGIADDLALHDRQPFLQRRQLVNAAGTKQAHEFAVRALADGGQLCVACGGDTQAKTAPVTGIGFGTQATAAFKTLHQGRSGGHGDAKESGQFTHGACRVAGDEVQAPELRHADVLADMHTHGSAQGVHHGGHDIQQITRAAVDSGRSGLL